MVQNSDDSPFIFDQSGTMPGVGTLLLRRPPSGPREALSGMLTARRGEFRKFHSSPMRPKAGIVNWGPSELEMFRAPRQVLEGVKKGQSVLVLIPLKETVGGASLVFRAHTCVQASDEQKLMWAGIRLSPMKMLDAWEALLSLQHYKVTTQPHERHLFTTLGLQHGERLEFFLVGPTTRPEGLLIMVR
jgi:hypothetical protein